MKLKAALSFIGSTKQHEDPTMLLRSITRNAAIAGRSAQRQRNHADQSALWLAAYRDNGDLSHITLDASVEPETCQSWAGPFLPDQRSNE